MPSTFTSANIRQSVAYTHTHTHTRAHTLTYIVSGCTRILVDRYTHSHSSSKKCHYAHGHVHTVAYVQAHVATHTRTQTM